MLISHSVRVGDWWRARGGGCRPARRQGLRRSAAGMARRQATAAEPGARPAGRKAGRAGPAAGADRQRRPRRVAAGPCWCAARLASARPGWSRRRSGRPNEHGLACISPGRSTSAVPPGVIRSARSCAACSRSTARAIRRPPRPKSWREGVVADEDQVFLNDLLDLAQPPALRAVYEAMDNARRNPGQAGGHGASGGMAPAEHAAAGCWWSRTCIGRTASRSPIWHGWPRRRANAHACCC